MCTAFILKHMCCYSTSQTLSCLQEEQRKRDHEERLDRAARSVSEEMEVCVQCWGSLMAYVKRYSTWLWKLNFFREIPWLYRAAIDRFRSSPMQNGHGRLCLICMGMISVQIWTKKWQKVAISNYAVLNTYADLTHQCWRKKTLQGLHHIFGCINKAYCLCTNGIQNVCVCAYCNLCTTSANSTRNTLIAHTQSADCPEEIRTAVNGPMWADQRLCGANVCGNWHG